MINRKCNGRYIIVDGKVTPEPDLIKWAMWFEVDENRLVKHERVDGYTISTIFLGLDYDPIGPVPVLWETMAFKDLEIPRMVLGRPMFREPMMQDRCSGNVEQALAMHERMVEKIKDQVQKVAPESKKV